MKKEVNILGTLEEAKLIMERLTTRFFIRGELIRFDPNYYPLDRGKFTVDIKPKDGDTWIKNWITVKKQSDHLSQLKLEVGEDDFHRVKEAWDIIKNELIRSGFLKISARRRGPTEKTIIRANIFKKIKEKNPVWGYERVALEANIEMKIDNISGETVRNAYRVMGWKWKQGLRSR